MVGPSLYFSPPTDILYHNTFVSYNNSQYDYYYDRECWLAFRSGFYFPSKTYQISFDDQDGAWTVPGINVTYARDRCEQYKNTTTYLDLQNKEFLSNSPTNFSSGVDNCELGRDVSCIIDEHPQEPSCRLEIRMFAAFTLLGCLTIKATYMIIINFKARGEKKTQCLTFGDVIVASVVDPTLCVHRECMVDSGDGHRHSVSHTCHKHCKDPELSSTGDGMGHCQKCGKFNIVDKAADLTHPCIATKHKKSLLSNLGSTALLQMILLMLTSVTMLVISLMLAVLMGSSASYYRYICKSESQSTSENSFCEGGIKNYLKAGYGTFGGIGGSASLGGLGSDSMTSEILAFGISNGAQLLYAILYLLLIYNITLIVMEHRWGKFGEQRQRLRCTLVRGSNFDQSYLLQLPKKVLYPAMVFSSTMHWLLGQAISTQEAIYQNPTTHQEHSVYFVSILSGAWNPF